MSRDGQKFSSNSRVGEDRARFNDTAVRKSLPSSNQHLAKLAEIAKNFAPSFDRVSRSSYAARSRGRKKKEGRGGGRGEEKGGEEGSVDTAVTAVVFGCTDAALAASRVNERAAVRGNTAHAPAHFTPPLIDRCPFGPFAPSLAHPRSSSIFRSSPLFQFLFPSRRRRHLGRT